MYFIILPWKIILEICFKFDFETEEFLGLQNSEAVHGQKPWNHGESGGIYG